MLTFDLYCSILLSIFWALICVSVAGPGIAAFGADGPGVPIGVASAADNWIRDNNTFCKSDKNLSPNIKDSNAFLSPRYISFEFKTDVGESILILFTEFKLIESWDDSKIESVLELNNKRPEFKIICS